jgi:hypothetical protein
MISLFDHLYGIHSSKSLTAKGSADIILTLLINGSILMMNIHPCSGQ